MLHCLRGSTKNEDVVNNAGKASRPDPRDSRGFKRKRFSELEESGGIFDTRKRLWAFLLCLTSWLFSSLKIVWAKA